MPRFPAILCLALLMTTPALSADPPLASTTAGEVQGTTSPYDANVLVFKGIPFAADTGGANRFKAPQPVAPWDGVRDATSFSSQCPGFPDVPPTFPQGTVDDFDHSPVGEDCLALNLWTPALDDGKRPVLVYFHEGGFVAGSAGSIRLDGTRMAGRQDVVFVTVNFRVNTFGFLNLTAKGADYVANAGLLDMIAALHWVHDNIVGFGGDPGNVTFIGQSAGANAALLMLDIPAAHGLFHKAIALSGQLYPLSPSEESLGQAEGSLATIGLGSDLAGIADLPFGLFLGAYAGNGPTIDGKLLTAAPWRDSAPDVSADVPLLLGWTATETTFFDGSQAVAGDDPIEPAVAARLGASAADLVAPYRAEFPVATGNEIYFRMVADYDFGGPALRVAALKAAQHKAPVYVYRLEATTELQGLMSPHSLDVAYVLDNLALAHRISGDVTAEKQALADTISTAIATFARTGTPAAPDLPAWPAYDAAAPQIMLLKPQPKAVALPPTTAAAATLCIGSGETSDEVTGVMACP